MHSALTLEHHALKDSTLRLADESAVVHAGPMAVLDSPFRSVEHEAMGTFIVDLDIGDPQGNSWQTVYALADTGSSYTGIPRDLLESLDVQPQLRREFETADGRMVERDMAVTMARREDEIIPTLVVFADNGDATMFGAYTMEGFSLAPDPVNQRLVRLLGLAMGADTP